MDKESIFFKMPTDVYQIRNGFRPIRMREFLQMLTVDAKAVTGFLGESTGWTRYEGIGGLVVMGGWCNVGGERDEFLEHVEYGKNLANPYNNYVNPFFLLPIMNDAGKRFFLRYYDSELNKEIGRQKTAIDGLLEVVEIRKRQLERHLNELKVMEVTND